MGIPVLGVGTTLYVGDGASPETFPSENEIAEVLSISGPEMDSDEVEVTPLNTPGAAKQYIGGLIDNGQMQLELNWIASQQQVQLINDQRTAVRRTYRITWPTSPESSATFQAFVKTISFNTEAGAQIRNTMTLRITGAVEFTPELEPA